MNSNRLEEERSSINTNNFFRKFDRQFIVVLSIVNGIFRHETAMA
jgi:hypothetical protein